MKIRDAFIKAGHTSEIVTVTLPDVGEIKVEVRSKTVDEQYALIDKTRKPKGDIDARLLAVETIIATAYEPGTDDRAFDPADRDMLLGSDSGAFQSLLAASNRAAGLQGEDEVVSDLDETPVDATSTS